MMMQGLTLPATDRLRRALMTSSALLALPAAAQAQSSAETPRPQIAQDYASAANAIEAVPGLRVTDEPQIVISQPGTTTSAIDNAGGVNGVGQMFVSAGGGSLSLCTGTLINPRTVIFAAHCVNTRAAADYGTARGGTPISFGFKTDNLTGVREWLLDTLGGRANSDQFKTKAANALYNVNQVSWNPASQRTGFLEGDVALATLDTPATGIPTWALLFSALPAPASISNDSGTGYHVTVTGYGRSGVGNQGDTNGIDFRRRVAENYIGMLGSLDDRNLWLFGQGANLPQNLYQIDFDDPRRGTSSASRFDFNLFRDKALPNEGTTAGGDSGGPLILDRTFARQVVIGVLSGGSRFYNAQASSSYGTSSFYQPLYLFWDYIAANNPYRYAAAKAGDGAWEDGTHWVTTTDPAYQIIQNGQLTNGVPTSPGLGLANDPTNKFGDICDGVECYNVKTGAVTRQDADGTGQTGTGEANAAGKAILTETSRTATDEAQASGSATAAALPAATIANGLPGATNFVPNNVDPSRTVAARYYDVTLSAAGNTTLSSSATVDRFTLNGSEARLTVASGGTLSTVAEFNHLAGMVANSGTINAGGDYLMLAGGLQGTGRINSRFFTSVSGMIAPGTTGTIGTLTFGGNVILASGTQLLIDVGPSGTSDKIAVVANNGSGGQLNVGGSVGFAPVSGQVIRAGDVYTIATATGGISGQFNSPAALSAILTPTLAYSANAITARIVAGSYANVVNATPYQTAYARLLDQNRSNQANLSSLYGTLDLASAASIRTSLEGLVPSTEALKRAQGTMALDNTARFYREHLATLSPREGLGGTLTMVGQPVQVASLAMSNLAGTQAQMATDSGGVSMRENVLPENVAVFLAGGYLDGRSRALPQTTSSNVRDRFDGFYVATGIETEVDEASIIGFGFSYTKTTGNTSFGQYARGDLYQGTLYGKTELGGVSLDSQFSAGVFQARTQRNVSLAGVAYDLRSRDNALALSSEVGLAKTYSFGGLKIGPRIAARVSHLGFTPTAETGGGPALRYDRQDYNSVQGRAGLMLSSDGPFRPYASAYYVHDFQDRPGVFGANFAGGIGPSALFALPGQDKNWGEASMGVSYVAGRVQLSLGADTTFERRDVENQSYRGTIKIAF
ncbi:autotransporter domain-containing protein [Sphingomonas sp. 1185]|uniref:autotransporter domain-containing protein n=1 Tax=Sphingomonas sp. 1185 TaxID=3156411 RepID=UPI003394FC00